MRSFNKKSARPVDTAALSVVFLSGVALAQQAADGGLEEIVITATRQESTVNRVALSVSAVTQRSMDQQGIKDISDLARTVPALSISGQQGGVSTFSIRGVVSLQGAPTTGVYLDDTPLQKRSVAGASFQTAANGTPGPALFDLERVEVLRGPQGTLYGGSSQGGTVRYITPTPGLRDYSGYIRAETSDVSYGGRGFDVGLAAGGPLVEDKLGARISVYRRHNAGYIDYLDPYRGGEVRYKDINELDTTAVRASLLWKLGAATTVSASLYHSEDDDKGGGSGYNLPIAGTLSTPELCFLGSTAAVPCTTAGAYHRPAATYGPFPYLEKRFNRIDTREPSPALTKLDAATVTLGHEFAAFEAKAITSWIGDRTANTNPELPQIANFQYITTEPNRFGFPLFEIWPDYPGVFDNANSRKGLVEELRFTGGDASTRFTWVGGLYYSYIRGHASYKLYQDMERTSQLLYGLTTLERYGLAELPQQVASSRDQVLVDKELAAFGEGSFRVTDKFTVTAGLRASQVEFKYRQVLYGLLNGWSIPTVENSGLAGGSVKENPMSPKFGVEYRFSDTKMVYANSAKGYRAGGANSPLSNVCVPGLALVGMTLNDVPRTYGSDTVWSYEVGAKIRALGGRVQLNTSAFLIDWSGVQLNVGTPGCGQTYVSNAGKARSQGFDLTAEGRIFGGLSATLSVGYNDAKYTSDATGPAPLSGAAPALIVRSGDTLSVPPWMASLGAQYDFRVGNNLNAFVRWDGQYASNYYRGLGPGINSYSPDNYRAPETFYASARAGINYGNLGLNLFVKNLFNSDDELGRSATRTGCSAATGAACTTYTRYAPITIVNTFRPREIGIQASYRY